MYQQDTTKLQIAQDYSSTHGWSVFPVHCIEENGICSCGAFLCKEAGKHPVTSSGVKDATRDPDKLREYFDGKNAVANLGLATGAISGVSVLDVDGEQGLATLKELEGRSGSLPKTVLQQTGSGVGRQYFFSHDERWDKKKNSVKFLPGLDVRTTGGYVLLPPSNHKSGKQYRWLVSPKNTNLAPAPDWLLDLIPDRDDTKIVSEPKKVDTKVVSEPTPEPVKPEPTPKTDSKTERVERARTINERVVLYLERTPPAISGQGGHGTTYNVCCRLVELFPELSDDEIFDSMTDWNNRCDPSWTEKELRRKIKEGRKKVGVRENSTLESNKEDGDREAVPESSEIDSTSLLNNDGCDGYPTLSNDAYHGIVGDILRTLDPITEADPASILMTFLTAFGIAVGRTPHFVVEGTRHHANLFTALVGQSSRARKGTSLGRVNELMTGITSPTESGLSTGEGLIHRVRDNTPDKEGVKDKRLWIIETEFVRCMQVMKREGNTLSAILRDAWDNGNMSVLTKMNSVSSTNAHIGITAHITNDELKLTMKAVDAYNGFSNRFLWTSVRRSKFLPDGGDCDLSDLRFRIATVFETAKTIERMTRSAECSTLWRTVYPILGAEKLGIWDAVTARAEAQVVRLSMLYALLDGSSVIEVDHLKAALAVWDYCDQSAKLLFDDPESVWNKILAYVTKTPGVNQSDVRKQFGHGENTGRKFQIALDGLLKRGEIVAVPVYDKRQATTLYPGVRRETPNSLTPDSRPEPAKTEDTTTTTTEVVGTPIPELTTTPATLTELFEWKNANGIEFVRGESGEVWVTQGHRLKTTPAIEECIRRNQSVVSSFVISRPPIVPVAAESTTPNPERPQAEDIEDDAEMSEWSRDFLKELESLKSSLKQ